MLPPGVYLHQLVHWVVGRDALPEGVSDRPVDANLSPGLHPLIWCHVGDVGELPSLQDFIRQVLQSHDDLHFLITGPIGIAGSTVPDGLDGALTFHPLPKRDLKSAGAFLDTWQPDLVMWMDQQFEVALLAEVHQREIPSIWVNARSPLLNQPALAWLRGTARMLASGFDTILAENEGSKAALSRLGVSARKLRVAGALQRQTQPPHCNMAERDDLAMLLGTRPIWLALNTAAEEDASVIEAHRQVMRKSHRLLLVIVPDDPARAPQLAQELERDGWLVALRSEGQDPTSEVQIYIADFPGEDGLWMHLSPITFLGHSLSGGACLSPNAAASLGSVVLFGSEIKQHEDAFDRLEAAGAARRVKCRNHLAREVEYLLQPQNAAQMAMAAWDITTSGAELSGRIERLILDLLDKKGR